MAGVFTKSTGTADSAWHFPLNKIRVNAVAFKQYQRILEDSEKKRCKLYQCL